MPDNDENLAKKGPKISWWKIAVGIFLVFVDLRSWLTPNQDYPAALRASNETQQGSIFLVYSVIFLVGLGFPVAGLRSLWLDKA